MLICMCVCILAYRQQFGKSVHSTQEVGKHVCERIF